MKDQNPEQETKAGYMVIRLKPGEGVIINNNIEVRVAIRSTASEIQLAIRAPKDLPIRRVR